MTISVEKFESFERINSIRETNGNFDSCNSCKRLVPSRLHELHESKFPFVSRIEFIRSKLSNFSAHVSGVRVLNSHTPGRAATLVPYVAPGYRRPAGFAETALSGGREVWRIGLGPVLTAPVRAAPALVATTPVEAVVTGRNGPGRAWTAADRAGTALTGAVRTGL